MVRFNRPRGILTGETPKTIQWGKKRVISEEVAVPFHASLYWVALAAAQKWAEETEGRIESAHGILETRIEEAKVIPDLSGPAWRPWLTANSEEDAGIDTEGRFGRKGEFVGAVIHGGGIMLDSPKSLQAAFTHMTPRKEPSINQGDLSRLLAGFLPDGQQIRIYTLDQLMKDDPAELPKIYAIVAPLQEFSETRSVRVTVDELPKIKLFIARAGHPQTADNYAKALRNAGVREYGNWHEFTNTDPNTSSGHVIRVQAGHNGLKNSDGLRDYARFVCVNQINMAQEYVLPQKTFKTSRTNSFKG